MSSAVLSQLTCKHDVTRISERSGEHYMTLEVKAKTMPRHVPCFCFVVKLHCESPCDFSCNLKTLLVVILLSVMNCMQHQ